MANPSNFRNINLVSMLYETLTGVFSINKTGLPTWYYKLCVACLAVLQAPLTDFYAFRNKEYLIANCKWQVGQLTNVLNFLYDPIQNRINIQQSIATPQFLSQFAYPPLQYLSDFDTPPLEFWRTFNDQSATSIVTINVPAGINLSDLTATVAQIAISGVPYQIAVV